MAGKTGQRLARLFRGMLAQPAPLARDERTLATLEDLERLSLARLNQAEQIFEFEVLAVEAKSSLDALRFFDLLFAVLLAAQIIAGILLVGRGDADGVAVLAILGAAVALACWGLAVTSWAETGPVGGTFLTDLAADPASARASAVIRAAGVAKRNEGRRLLKGRLFALAVVLTVGDCAWVATAQARAAAAPPPVAATPSPAPTASPAPTPRPTARPVRRAQHARPRRTASRPGPRTRTNSSR